ncbi:MAG TPA: DUF4870 domain-containing protein [Nitriliruptorales bacterium]|nr:DUF4870 domain-containing protein [Nitriliruptorales bacterium]
MSVDPPPPEPPSGAPPPSQAGPPPPPGSPGGYGQLPGQPYPPHPSGLPSDVRNWAMAAHLSTIVASFVMLPFLGPLIVWLIKREEHPFIDQHGKEALNFNLSVLLYTVVGTVAAVLVAIVTFGVAMLIVVPLALALGIGWLVVTILAAVRASNGEPYRYPVTIRFVS